jgi:hypothetical protein
MTIAALVFYCLPCPAQNPVYSWITRSRITETVGDIPAPAGYKRVVLDSTSFQHWLRGLPLRDSNVVFLYNGRVKPNQGAHYRILDIDVGDRDLQQCADAVMRLRAEYLFSKERYEDIHFDFTSGDRAAFVDWVSGYRPVILGNKVRWEKQTGPQLTYANFRAYMNTVFTYAGTYSLSAEMDSVMNVEYVQVGDVFIEGGFPGHAVIVLDVAISQATGEKALLLAQSYTPAQDVHILKNLQDPESSPWYVVKKEAKLFTPEWVFDWEDLKRFPKEPRIKAPSFGGGY